MELDVRAASARAERRRFFESAVLVEGVVEHGDERGRELGFPTANLALPTGTPAGDGVWAATVEFDDGRLVPACVSVGRRPTFYARDGVRLLEAHLVDFSGDLYGLHLRVWLDHRLRLQKRFASVEGLCDQMQSDVEDTRRWAMVAPWLVLQGEHWRNGRFPEAARLGNGDGV